MNSLQVRWQEAADTVGGILEDTGARHVVALHMDGCTIEAGTTDAGRNALTWLAAEAPGSAGLRLAVSQGDHPFRGAFAITSGDPAFDRQFSIKTNDAPFARLWLDDEVRGLIAAASPAYHFVLEGGRARAWRFAGASEPDELVHAVRALCSLTRRGRQLQREWADLADGIGGRLAAEPHTWRPDGAISINVPLPQATVVVDGFFGVLARRRSGRGLFTRVRCPRRSLTRDHYIVYDARGRRALRPRLPATMRPLTVEHSALSQRYRIECEDTERALPRFDERVCRQIASAGPELIIADPRHVTVFFLEYESDSERICAGVEIAESLAIELTPEGLAGPYR